MCGILGTTGRHEKAGARSLRTLVHRGPDAQHIHADEHITLGHARLSIIDLDARANQPFFTEDGSVGIVFNGEIYNYLLLKDELIQKGHHFRTTSDTEVLLMAYLEWGGDFVTRLRGMFSLALYDTRDSTVRLYVDHAGIKPLYYWRVGRELVFASELKAVVVLLKERSVSGVVSKEALTLYSALGYVPAPYTLYKDIFKLSPRSYVVFSITTGECVTGVYEVSKSLPVTSPQLLSDINESVKEHLIADVPVGLFFSGGTDSSLIAALLNAHGVSLKAFCVELPERPEDARYAVSIAKRLNIPLNVLPFTVETFEQVAEEVLEKIDDPIADSSLFPTYFVSKEARKEVTVVLSGEGGDEYFFGYPRSRDLYNLRTAPLDTKVSILEKLFFILPMFRGKNKLFERLYVWSKMPLAFYLLTMSPTKTSMGLSVWEKAKTHLANLLTDSSLLDANLYLPNVLLRKTDMATMYASLEGRVPLLDVRVVEAARVMHQPKPVPELKPVLKSLLCTFLPREDVYRKKTGFGLRTPHLYHNSSFLREEYAKAVSYLTERQLFDARIPSIEVMLTSNPNMCWQIIMLYRAFKNLQYGI